MLRNKSGIDRFQSILFRDLLNTNRKKRNCFFVSQNPACQMVLSTEYKLRSKQGFLARELWLLCETIRSFRGISNIDQTVKSSVSNIL